MLIDFNKAPTTLANRKYDVCVVGSGPAGMTVARELAAGGQRVALLEAGGTERTDRSQAIYRGQETGLKTWNAIETCRLRYLGGTSNHWSGQCGVFDESAFWPKRHHDLPGWPIERKELHAFLPRALEILDLGAVDFSPRAIVASKPSRFETTKLHMSAPTRFGTKYGKELAESSRIDLYLNANVIDLQLVAPTTASPRVATALVRNYDKGGASVQASRFVLAMGSVENARLLLNSNRQIEAGIGNETDWVGRCFMEHLNAQVGRFVVRDREFFKSNSSAFSPNQEMMRQLRIGAGVLALDPDYMPRGYTGRLGKVKDVLRDTACRFETISEYTRKFADYNCEGEGIITSLIEQVPDRDSRVTLQRETDEFGKRRAHLHWVINDADRRTIRTMALEMARELLDLDVARVKLSPFITDVDREIELSPHCHQMGTTRMSKDHRYGVVDPNCKVHSVANLYIAGSSVFSTGGGINPTLTVVMQALRLGQHLRSA